MVAKMEKIVVLRKNLEAYLSSVFGEDVDVVNITALDREKKRVEEHEENDLKGFGYGTPYLIILNVKGHRRKIVLETMRTNGFGHDHFSDRAGILLWQYSAFNKLPRHVPSVDVGAFTNNQSLKSVGDCNEFFIITDFVEGKLYHKDLDRLKSFKQLSPLDLKRCKALSNYLVEIHKDKNDMKELYIRRIRDLMGHGECIMGLLDSYPHDLGYIDTKDLVAIEKRCVEWRWKLKNFTHRLAQVHGDFHPWNILFHEGTDFTVLDRSRGEWGEPADDISSLTINYLFYSLQIHRQLAEPFTQLFNLFWENYLSKTKDDEILDVIPPFLAWRSLVLASPIWYPNLHKQVRAKLFNFVLNILNASSLDLKNVNSYFNRKSR